MGPANRPTGNADGRFDVDHLRHQLGRRVVSGGMISASAQTVRIVLNLLSIAILARLIPPEEFGIVALALPISFLASDIAQHALGQVTVQRQRITQAEVSGLFWANLLIAGAVTLLLMLASGAVAAFYEDERVAPVLMALALMTFLAGATSQFSAVLSREMRFWALHGSAIFAEICGIVCAVSAAYAGLSYWAIVIQILARQSSLLAFRVIASRWLPDGPATLGRARGLVTMGGDLAIFSFLTQLGHALGMVAIGRTLGDVQAALFFRASNVAHWPMTQLLGPMGAVITPALSRVAGDSDRFDAVYQRILIQTAMAAVPMAATFIALAEPFTLILLGAEWREAAIILALLGLRTFSVPLESLVRWRLIAAGSTHVLRRFAFPAMALTLLGYWIGVQFGVVATALIQGVLAVAVLMPLLVWAAQGRGGLRFGTFFRIVMPFFLALALVVLAAHLSYRYLAANWPAADTPLLFVIGVAVVFGSHLCLCLAIPRYRREIVDVGGKVLSFAR